MLERKELDGLAGTPRDADSCDSRKEAKIKCFCYVLFKKKEKKKKNLKYVLQSPG